MELEEAFNYGRQADKIDAKRAGRKLYSVDGVEYGVDDIADFLWQ